MPQPATNRPTHVLSAAASLLRILTPSALGMLLAIHNNTRPKQTQSEMASAVGRSQSTVSDYLTDIAESDPPLAVSRSQRFEVTETGEKIIDLISNVTAQLGCDLSTVDWTDETDKEQVGELLTPLHDSRSVIPLFVLDSLSERSSPHDTPSPVWIDDILHDVENRRAESDVGAISMSKIRRTIRLRFVDTDTARFDDNQVTLTEKGVLHARLLDEFTQFLEEELEIESPARETDEDSSRPKLSERPSNFDATRSDQDDSSHQAVLGDLDQQNAPQRSHDSEQRSVPNPEEMQEQPGLIPVYRLRSERADDPELILPFTMTIEDLLVIARQLGDEYNLSAQLDLDWMIQTDSGLYPATPTDTSPQSSPRDLIDNPQK